VSDVQSTEELTAKNASGLRWMTYGRMASEVIMLASMVLLARLISPAAFGMFAVVVILQELAFSMPMEGVGSALVQRKEIDRTHMQAGMLLSLLISAVLTAVTFAAAILVVRPIYGAQTETLVLLATPWFLIGACYATPVAVLRRDLDFRKLAILDFTQTSVRIATTVPLALMGLDAKALVLGNMAGIASGLVLALTWVRVPLPRWRPAAVRDLLPYGGPAALACIAWTGFRNGDYAIIGGRLGAAQAGFYWRGYQLAVEYQRKISSVMAQMAFPTLARTEGPEAMAELRTRMTRLLTVTLFPLLVLLVVLAPVVVPWLFGPEWRPAVVPAQILAAGGAASLVIDAVGAVLMAQGRSQALLGYGVAHFAVYIGAVLVVSKHGLAAVAVAASIVHAGFLVVAYVLLAVGQQRRTLRLLWDDLGAALTSCLALALIAFPLEGALHHAGAPALVHMVLVAPAGLAAYAVALRAVSPAGWRDLCSALGRVLPLGRLSRVVASLRGRRTPVMQGD
jgi:PST family polysaccharide transporter